MSKNALLVERTLNLSKLETPVRRVIFVTYAILLGLALGVVFRDRWPEPHVTALPAYPIPYVVAVASGIVMTIAVALLLTGAAKAKTSLRYLIFVPVEGGFVWWILNLVFSDGGAFTASGSTLALLCSMICAFLFLSADIVIRSPLLSISQVLTRFLVLCFGCALVVTYVSITDIPGFAPTVLLYTFVFGALFFLQPGLLAVGFDLAEIASAAALACIARPPPTGSARRRLVRLCIEFAVAGVAGTLHFVLGFRDALGAMLVGLSVVAVSLAAVLYTMRAARRAFRYAEPDLHLTYIKVATVALAVGLTALATESDERDPRYFDNSSGHVFSVLVPAGMEVRGMVEPTDASDKNSTVRVEFQTTGNILPFIFITGYTASESNPTTVNALLSSDIVLPDMELKMADPDKKDGWSRDRDEARYKTIDLGFYVLQRKIESPLPDYRMNWFIVCGGLSAELEQIGQMCERVRASFIADHHKRTSQTAIVVSALLLFVCAAVALFMTNVSGFYDSPILDLLFWVLLLMALSGASSYVLGLDTSPYEHPSVMADLLSALLMAGVVAALVLEMIPSGRAKHFDLEGMRSLAMHALASLGMIGALFYVYVFVSDLTEWSQIIRGVVICLAVTWELAMSGPMLNPEETESHLFPRPSRALVFTAYLLLVATGVFLFAPTDSIAIAGVNAGWDTERVVASGIAFLGGAFVVKRTLRSLPNLMLRSAPRSNREPEKP